MSESFQSRSPLAFNRRELLILRSYRAWSFMGERWLRFRYRDRVRFGRDCRIDAGTFSLRGLGVVELGDAVIIERGIHKVFFNLEPGARVSIGAGTWFQTFNDDLVFSCKAGAEITLGKNCWFSGGLYGASERITIGDHTLIGYGCMILDSDLHKLDNDSHTIVLKGVTIGNHCVIGTGSIVLDDIPDHSFAAGRPAHVIKKIGDRDRVS
jgi:acetyltransferase-like isoleucine patch superfamily enzyme